MSDADPDCVAFTLKSLADLTKSPDMIPVSYLGGPADGCESGMPAGDLLWLCRTGHPVYLALNRTRTRFAAYYVADGGNAQAGFKLRFRETVAARLP